MFKASTVTSRPNLDPTLRGFRLELFAAIRDSVFHAAPPDDNLENFNTRRSRRHKWNMANKHRNDAREWIRAGAMTADDTGHGFGYLWDSMRTMGVVHHSLGGFIYNMENLWHQVDRNPKLGSRIITLMKGLIDRTDEEGITADPTAEISRMKGDQDD